MKVTVDYMDKFEEKEMLKKRPFAKKRGVIGWLTVVLRIRLRVFLITCKEVEKKQENQN